MGWFPALMPKPGEQARFHAFVDLSTPGLCLPRWAPLILVYPQGPPPSDH